VGLWEQTSWLNLEIVGVVGVTAIYQQQRQADMHQTATGLNLRLTAEFVGRHERA
jgi:hypothetical protein